MNTTQHAELLWATGNFRDPDFPEAHNVEKDELPKLTKNDEAFKAAVRSRQSYFQGEMDEFCLRHHGRLSYATDGGDGDVGVATEQLLRMPRCAHPDFRMTEKDDPELAKFFHQGPQAANWPDECRFSLITSRSFASLPGLTEEQTDGVWWASCHNWTESIEDLQMTPGEVGDLHSADFYAVLARLGGSTLAWSYLARNRCDVRLDQAYNSRVNWSVRLAATTKTHEDGHALGLEHQRDRNATMYPSINSAAESRYGYPNATDIQAMERLGYHPFDDWERRKPPESKLFLPRDVGPELLEAIVLRGKHGGELVFPVPMSVSLADARQFLLDMMT